LKNEFENKKEKNNLRNCTTHDNEALRRAGIGATDYPELATLLSIVLVTAMSNGDNGSSSHLISSHIASAADRAHFFLSFFFKPHPCW